MAANVVASPKATTGNTLASDSASLAELVMLAATRLGYQHDRIGGLFGGMSVAEVSKNFGPNNPERNRLMKQELPLLFLRELALVLCEKTGQVVAGPDAERHALGDLLAACAQYVRLHQR
jgi:hypothetical protein